MRTPWRSSNARASAERHRGAAADRRVQRAQVGPVLVGIAQQVGVDRRHARHHRAALALDQPRERLRAEVAARHHEGRATERRRIRQTPRVDVEHRHDDQHAIAGGDPERAAHQHAGRVQRARAVRVEDALRVAGRARRVTERSRLALVELRVVRRRRAPPPRAAPRSAGSAAGRRSARRPSRRSARRCSSRPRERRERRDQRVVDEDDSILGVIDHVGDLVREEARVDGVEDGADAGDREVALEVALRVPRERADRGRRARCRARRAPARDGRFARRPRRSPLRSTPACVAVTTSPARG